MAKVLITPPTFSREDSKTLDLLRTHNVEFDLNDRDVAFTKEELKSMIGAYDGIILGVDPCNREVLEQAPNLKVVSRFGVGADNVDVKYLNEHDIAFYRTIGANADAVADCAFTLMMSVARNVMYLDNEIKSGKWYDAQTHEMSFKTLGLIGLGDIGKKVAQRAKGFQMNILAYDVVKNQEVADQYGITYVDTIEEIMETADFISIHVPLIPSTYHLIDEKKLRMMKDTAVIVNTARGGIIDESALAKVLQEGVIWGAGLDVFENEPLEADSPLKKLSNIILLPHCSADTFETTIKVSRAATENLLKGLGCL